LVDEGGDALAGIRVEYQSRPDSLVAIRCVDPARGLREAQVWTRPDGTILSLTLKSKESADLSAGLAPIDWQIDPTAASLLEPVTEWLIGWEAVAPLLWERWKGWTGRVAIQLYASTRTSFAVELDHSETIETLMAHLQQTQQPTAATLRGITPLKVQIFEGGLDLRESVILYIRLFEDANLERLVREALRRPRLTLEDVASLTGLWADNKTIHILVGLEYLTSLQELALGSNQIVDITPLTALKNLETLYLSHNQIVDITPLASLTRLHWLILDNNLIKDLAPLVSNIGLGEKDKVNVENNPLSDQALNEQIPALKARGVSVYY